MLRQLLLSDFRSEGPAAGHGWPLVQHTFPTVHLGPLAAGRGGNVLHLDASEWNAPAFDPVAWDARVFEAAERSEWLSLHLDGASREALVVAALEILTRYQCLVRRRNAASVTPLFNRLLARHRSLHDLKQPQVRARFHRAVDAWQWTLRLRPDVDLPPQAAAFFHEQEGEQPTTQVRADRAAQVLEEAGADDATCRRVREMLMRDARPANARDVSLLDAADALSFFCRESSAWFREAAPEHRRRQVARMLARLRPEHLRWLGHMRLAPAVRGQLEVLLAAHFPVDDTA
ncbi:DUF4202 domain-containing protein [Myxococcus sp. AM001]|uniref:DUF4202 domain-containing protein n=1 Tax=Myxococcus vastator TaxID=2709664 RepID=UPI0013D55782|nr:DUF4202 domain-containing protein [Myxococcus vastator]NVJ06198.1 DUF4202 domain-containing protein [Myxococcus sp. AM001]